MFLVVLKLIMKFVLGVAEYAGGIVVFILSILTAIDAGGRYLFNAPIVGTLELSELLFASIVAFSLGPVTDRGEQIVVDILFVKFQPRTQRMVLMITDSVAAILFAIITWQSTLRAMESLHRGEFTGALGLPIYPVRFLFALGFFVTLCVVMGRIFGSLRGSGSS